MARPEQFVITEFDYKLTQYFENLTCMLVLDNIVPLLTMQSISKQNNIIRIEFLRNKNKNLIK